MTIVRWVKAARRSLFNAHSGDRIGRSAVTALSCLLAVFLMSGVSLGQALAGPSTTTVTSSLNPSLVGQTVTLGIRVTATTGTVAPSGQANVSDSLGSFGTFPVTLTPVTQTAVAAGWAHSCSLDNAGAVRCWGANGYGQLGNGLLQNGLTSPTTPAISSGATAVAGGYYHTCAIVTGGALRCWGYNALGQLGDGTTTDRRTAVTVIASGVTQVDGGIYYTCAVVSGAVKCWGSGPTSSNTPTTIIASGATAVAVGSAHACALVADAVKCWGNNQFNQIGDGTTTYRNTPVTTISSGATAIAAGYYHSCALVSGAAQCWGYNNVGQLGDGTTTSRSLPVTVFASGATAIGSGYDHTCAVISGATYCWGKNDYGQIGDGTLTNRSSPVQIFASAATSLAFGQGHTCALVSNAVQCWGGFNGYGSLGNGAFSDQATPGATIGLGASTFSFATNGLSVGVHTISAAYFTDGVTSASSGNATQTVQANTATALTSSANPSMFGQSTTLTATVTSGSGTPTGNVTFFDGATSLGSIALNGSGVATLAVAALSVGTHSLTATYNGATTYLTSTSSALSQQVDQGATSLVVTATPSPGVLGQSVTLTATVSATAPAAGTPTGTVDIYDGMTLLTTATLSAGVASFSTSALTVGNHSISANYSGDTNFTASSSGVGELIQATTSTALSPSPTTTKLGESVSFTATVTSGSGTPAGTVTFKDGATALGSGALNGSGVATFTTSALAVGTYSITAEYAGAGNFIASTSSASSYTVGRSDSATTLASSLNPSTFGQPVSFTAKVTPLTGRISPTGNVTFTDTVAGSLGSAALTPLAPTQVVGGDSHTCVLTGAGAVLCSGVNVFGQLGDGSTTRRTIPVPVTGLGSGVAAIAAGAYHTCALSTAGAVSCWGWNDYGQIGDGTTATNRLTPVPVTGLSSGVAAIAAGGAHTCALSTTGAVSCWGWNISGQIGDNSNTSRPTPVPVSGLAGVTAIAAGFAHTCALASGGAASCWGNNYYGQVGDGSNTNALTPAAVSGLGGGVAKISGGSYHTCALTTGGGASCWGYNSSGQLGDGSTTDQPMPVAASGLSGQAALALGAEHSCALASNGTSSCWGNNNKGQIGDLTTTNQLTPVPVNVIGSATAVAAGGYFTCALTSGNVSCWGANGSGQHGDGTTTDHPSSAAQALTPVLSAAILTTTATQLAGGAHSVTASYVGDANNSASTSSALSQTVNEAPAFTSASSTAFTLRSAGSFAITTSGYPAAALSRTGALPSGVTFTANGDGTATLAGTPASGARGSYPLSLTAANGFAPDATQSFTLTVDGAPAVTGVAPSSGPTAGGTVVAISGADFGGATGV